MLKNSHLGVILSERRIPFSAHLAILRRFAPQNDIPDEI
jgi:hypothetical protein